MPVVYRRRLRFARAATTERIGDGVRGRIASSRCTRDGLGHVSSTRLIGEGAQGSGVSRSTPATATRFALKWYFPHTRHERSATRWTSSSSAGARASGSCGRSSWRRDPASGGFGYVMPSAARRLRRPRRAVTGQGRPAVPACSPPRPGARRRLPRAAQRGLCYRDISFGNVFFEPTTGRR